MFLIQGFHPWIAGFYRFLSLAQEGVPRFFLGEYSWHSWSSYFAVAFLIKTPVGSLALIVASLALCLTGSRLKRQEGIFLLLTVILFFAVMSQARVNIGLRHILPIYPFLFVLASRVATIQFGWRWGAPVLVVAPIVFTAVSCLRVAPHQLAYFNELVGGPGQGYRYLSDSNLDWGQA